ncbi:DNA excision repair protein ERCC-1 [Anolis carolinensis]|uniref:DNA excision repair protein ERCC-1 n=1 Tax=Anolis carolinensis TaxID=28377 RepID=H9GLC9_ANOCA|nr:PREDICTED: DNA excision repair protein ERCC-1 [Anolis carolinensis]|eukprot:XP_003229343.1 PREDICTED: DNA excision repair protein ERCC-1 [Anolis carolinensis]
MEPQAGEKAPKEGRKKFTVKTQDEEAAPVKPLFKPSSVSKDSVVPEATNVPGGKSYADYIVGQQTGSSSAPQAKQGTAGIPAAKSTTSAKPPPCEKRNIIAKGIGETSSSNPVLKPGTKQSSIIVSPRQRGNPVLKFIRNVPWEFGDIVPDYLLGQSTCALFLSLRYHNLNPNYIHDRLRNLGKTYALQVLLLQVDVKDPHRALKDLAKICILSSCTLVLAWSPEEAGRYLETYKAYEQKPADLLKEKVDKDYLSRMTDCLTSVKSVNKTDTLSLLSNFKSLANLVQASKEDLSLCPGIGPQKAKRLFDALHEPFYKHPKRTEASREQGSKE